MKPLIHCTGLACLGLFSSLAQAQVQTDFPPETRIPDAAAIRQQLADRSFEVKLADGSSWRIEFKSSGYMFLDTSKGVRDSGTWRSEDGQWCFDMQKFGKGCNTTREKDSQLYFKRISNGEVVGLVPRT